MSVFMCEGCYGGWDVEDNFVEEYEDGFYCHNCRGGSDEYEDKYYEGLE